MLGSKNLYFADNISVGVRDLGRVIAWYQEKLGLKLTTLKSEDFDALLSFEKNDEIGLALAVIPRGESAANIPSHPILYTKKIEAAHEEFSSRGISIGPIQRDSGGNRFFQFHDLEGNVVEVCHEP